VADIAFALRDLFDDSARQVNLRHASYLHFIQGYRSVRPIADEELALIPLFLRLHHLISFTRLHQAITPTNSAGDSPRMAELRGKLTAKMQRYRQEFSA
jgi:Ser/Thr protein kinase RdoA (MazF antagonist)